MFQLVDDIKNENTRTSISDSDEESDSSWKDESKAAYTLTSVESPPLTPLLGTSKRPKFGQSRNISLPSPAIAAGGCSSLTGAPYPKFGQSRNISLPSPATAAGGFSSLTGAPYPVSKKVSPLSVREPSFKSFNQGKSPVTHITDNIFNLLLKDLGNSKDPNQGYIYALSMEEYKGYIKIGRTRDSIAARKKDIKRCVGYNLHDFNANDHHLVPNYERVEELIHEELRNERRQFPCIVCLNKNATGIDCPRMHTEWFKISEAKASEVVDKWRGGCGLVHIARGS